MVMVMVVMVNHNRKVSSDQVDDGCKGGTDAYLPVAVRPVPAIQTLSLEPNSLPLCRHKRLDDRSAVCGLKTV